MAPHECQESGGGFFLNSCQAPLDQHSAVTDQNGRDEQSPIPAENDLAK